MAAFASLQLMWLSFTALNAILAILLARARMGRSARLLAVGLFALNASASALLFARDVGLPVGMSTGFYLNILSFAPLALLPWFAPFPRLSPRGRVVLVCAITALTLYSFTGAIMGAIPGDRLVFVVLVSLPPAVGCLLLADAHATSTSPAQRSFAAMLLAAYVLKIAANDLAWFMYPGRREGLEGALAIVPLALLGGALLTFGASLIRRIRSAGIGSVGTSELLVVGALTAGAYLATQPEFDESVEYLLLRPLLIAGGIIGVAFAEIDIREHRGLLGLGILAVGTGLFASIWTGKYDQTITPAAPARVMLAFVVGAGASAFLGWLLLNAMHGSAGEPRRLLVYRAALETSRAEGRGASAFEDLGSLRRRLGITPPEHDLLASDVNADVAVASLAPGQRFLGRYDIIREAGRGSAGIVYQARDAVEDSDVAIKRLVLDRRDIDAIERLQRETTLARAVEDEGLIRTHRVEFLRGEAFLVMDLMPGGSLSDVLRKRGQLPEAEALRIAHDALGGLAALHARGISHRDIKPGNILLDVRGRAKVSDFSIASDAISGDTLGGAASPRLVGTIGYMAPEVARGAPWAKAADLYSVAATLYESLAGRAAVDVAGLGEYEARNKVAQSRPSLPLPDVSGRTNRVLAKAMAFDPEDRYQSAAEMDDALAGR